MMSALPLASARISKLCILCVNDLLDGLYVQMSFHSIYSPFCLVFKHYFIKCVDFTRIAASSIASNYVTN